MKKKTLAFMVAGALMVSPLVAQCEEHEPITMYAVCNDSHINVRAKPSTKAEICGYLDFGWDVQVIDSAIDRSGNVWYKVDGISEYGYGYVYGAYLIDYKPELVDVEYKVESNGRVALYGKINGKRTGWAKNGAVLHVKIWSDEWALTDRGWIRTKYLTDVGS